MSRRILRRTHSLKRCVFTLMALEWRTRSSRLKTHQTTTGFACDRCALLRLRIGPLVSGSAVCLEPQVTNHSTARSLLLSPCSANLQAQRLLDAIDNNVDLSSHHADAVASLRIVLAADESIRTGRTVELL